MKYTNKSFSAGLSWPVKMLAILLGIALFSGIIGGLSRVDLFQGSILSLFNKIGLVAFESGEPDVGIEYVYLRKTANPSDVFAYYKYDATIVVRNYGEDFKDASVTVSAGATQKSAFIRNGLNGLSLTKGQTFIFDDYELLMDSKLNYEDFVFEISPKNINDNDLENNFYTVFAFEEPAEIENFSIESKDKKDDFVFSYDFESDMNLQLCSADEPDFLDENEFRYAEIDAGNDVYSFYKIKADPAILTSEKFTCDNFPKNGVTGSFGAYFDSGKDAVLFLKAVSDDNETGFANSNFLYLPAQEFMTRADFAKIFVESIGIDIKKDGKNYFKDILESDWFYPYVQTMFNKGLVSDPIDFAFNPNDVVYRADVLEPLLNYYDVDILSVDEGAPHFADVDKDSSGFFFAEALYSEGKAKAIGIYLHPENRASKQFLKYLINEFKEN
jgi:hypothetical protein